MLKARLTALLTALGELPPEVLTGGRGAAAQGFSRLLDEICPVGTLVLHDLHLKGSLDVQHLVVAPRGVVVIAPEWAPARLGAPRRGQAEAAGGPSRAPMSLPEPRTRRSGIVRSTLRQARQLRTRLEKAGWQGTDVLGAACCAPSIGAPPPPPVLMDDLWLGPVERLGPWLASGRLSPVEQAGIAHFVTEELATS